MKFSLFFLMIILSFSAIAQSEHVCHEFDQKLVKVELQVKDFDKELRKLEKKLENTEERLASRRLTLNNLIEERDRLEQTIRQIRADEPNLRQELQNLRNEASELSRVLAEKRSSYDYHVNAARVATSFSVKREHLRQSKRIEKEIERLTPQIQTVDRSIVSLERRIQQIDQQIIVHNQTILSLNSQIEQEQRDPAIIRLQQDRDQLLVEVSNSQITLDGLNKKLVKARDHVTMCYGYIELSVKYPTVLRLSKKVNNRGCDRYVPADQGSDLENLAQEELLTSMCR